MNQRARAAEDTRARIFRAAAKLFAKHGYRDTTVDKIAKLAGVAKGTFFVHFAAKEAVVTELVRKQVRTARKVRDTTLASGGTPLEALRATVLSLGDEAARNRELSRAVVTANLVSPLLGGFAESLFGSIRDGMRDDARAAQRVGLLTKKFDAEIIAETLIIAYFGALLHFATAPAARPLMAMLVPVVDANLLGFAPPSSSRPAPRGRAAKPARARSE